jgi:acetamidase/formamidase
VTGWSTRPPSKPLPKTSRSATTCASGSALRGPLGETGEAWIVIGFAASLDYALVACLRELIGWLSAAAGITGPEAYALASMAVSLRVTQYANQTGSAYTSVPPKAVHAVIPKSVFPADIRDRVTRWLRP